MTYSLLGFTDNMSFDNYGLWELDHIKPISSFNLDNIEEQKKCFNYNNIQPIWKEDNMKKEKANQLNLRSMSFFRQASGTAPNKLEVRYSTDDFATSTSWGAAPNSPTSGTGITWDFTDFTTPVNGTVKFRLYPYGTQRANGTTAAASGTFRVDDVTIYGNVVYGPTAASIASIGSQ